MIDARDNSFIDQSPCLTCPRHLQGLDKKDCIDKCKRLEAYRNGNSWVNEKIVKIDDKISIKNTNHGVKSSDTLQKTKKKGGIMPKVKKTSVKENEYDKAIKKVYFDPPIPKSQKSKKPNRDKIFKLYMTKYPGIMQYIIEVAKKSLLPSKDVFIQLLSEAIIARKDGNKS